MTGTEAAFYIVNMDVNRHWLSYYRLRLISIFALAFGLTGAFTAAQKSVENPGLGDLRIAEMLGEKGEYSDFFVNLQEQPEFARLNEKHGLDDPAAWTTLRRRFVLNLVDLQGSLAQAQSTMAIEDKRSGLDGKLISAESTRERGRIRHAQVLQQMEELRQMLRLMEEMEAALADAAPLTRQIKIRNKSGQAITAQVLLVDGSDLIIKSAEASYFRVPAEMLNHRTKLKILNEIFGDWQELPEMKIDPYAEEGEDRDELVAYNESRLYIKESTNGVFFKNRSKDERHFVPYATQLESARAALSQADRKDHDGHKSKIELIEQARALNQSRMETIQWYESRLAAEVPSS